MTRHDTNCPVLVRNGECGHLPGCEGGGETDQRERDVETVAEILYSQTPATACESLADLIAAARREAAGNNG